jgi:hypothetical protein
MLVASGCIGAGPPPPVIEPPAPVDPIATMNAVLAPDLLATANGTGVTLQTPADFHGDLALSVSLRVPTKTLCQTGVYAFGGRDRHGLWMVFGQTDEGGWFEGGWSSIGESDIYQVHAGDIDTRTTPSGAWAGTIISGGEREGFLNWTVIGFGLRPNEFSEGDPPFSFQARCEGPVQLVGARLGREAESFAPQTMTGGTGASARVVASGGSLQFDDQLRTRFDSPEVRMAVRGSIYGASHGTLTLEHPTGRDEWPLPSSPRIDFAGGSGDYQVGVTRVAAGAFDFFHGVLYGFSRSTWASENR